MKKGFVFLVLVISMVIGFSCSNTKSYGEMLKDERKAIKQMIKDSGFVILDKMPEDMKFAANEFVQLDGGIYMNVIDTGNGKRAVENTEVKVRFIQHGMGLNNDTSMYDCTLNHEYPLVFNYPLEASVYETAYGFPSTSAEYFYLSEGTSVPLKYVGEHGIVKLIVPFKKGSDSDRTAGLPRYYSWLKYTKFD